MRSKHDPNLLLKEVTMISPPIVCSNVNCKKLFFSNDMLFEPGANAIIRNIQVGSCPDCGASGYVPNGSYNFINNLIEVVIDSDTTIAELQELLKIFNSIEKTNVSPELTAQVIEEKVSKFPLLKRILPQNRQEAIEYLGFMAGYTGAIATVLTALIDLKGSEININIQNKTEVNNHINQIIIQKYSCDK